MSKIRLYGETSGFIELSAPDVADDNTVDLSLIPIIEDAPSDGQVLTWNASLSKWEAKDLKMKEKRIARFTGDGSWTVPAGVTYAIAHMIGGGGGVGSGTSGGDGASSSVAFASGTVTATGGNRQGAFEASVSGAIAGRANSGMPGSLRAFAGGSTGGDVSGSNSSGTRIVAGAAVTPGASIAVVVGNGGSAGTSGAAGGSGYVYIEYYEEA